MLLDTLMAIQRRTSWTSARQMMKLAGVEPGQGWQKTLKRYSEPEAHVSSGKLDDYLVQHILCGDKYTKLYHITDAERTALYGKIGQVVLADSTVQARRYPKLLDDSELAKAGGDLLPIAIHSNDDGYGIVFSTVFAIKVREEIDFEEFDNPVDMRQRFDEVVGLKFKRVQLFHVVWVPHHRPQLEIRVDAPKGMPEVAIHAQHSLLKSLVNSWGVVAIDEPVNLFPAVRAFYEDKLEGVVSEVTFSTTTGAVKNEKMLRRKTLFSDQREELYHLGGKSALGTDIRLYRITVEWPSVMDNLTIVPTLTLAASGPSGRGEGGAPVISGALIGSCVRASDYEFVIERLGIKSGLTR